MRDKLTKEYKIAKLKEYSKYFGSIRNLAAILGISENTFYAWTAGKFEPDNMKFLYIEAQIQRLLRERKGK